MLILAAVVYAQVAVASNLSGVWEAKRRFGPDARGTIVVRREGAAWTADFAGRTAAMRDEGGGLLTFAIPEGSFRARLEKDGIHGHWTQPRRVTDGGIHVTPVHLTPDGAQRWRGEIEPSEDVFTFYLKIGANGEAFLRNPERNATISWRIDRFARDGRVVRLYRGDEVVLEGTYDEATDTITFPIPNRGGTYDFRRATDASAFYARGRNGERYKYRPPLARDDGWAVGTLEEAHIDRTKIEAFVQSVIDLPIDSIHVSDIHAILVARHGKLVLEEYFHGEHRDKLHDTRSAAKSVTSVLFGAAGLDPSLPVYETLGAEADDPRKQAMKAEHLLTMASGFYCDDNDEKAPGREDFMQNEQPEKDWYRYTLRLPMSDAPGARPVYCSTNPNLLGAIIAKEGGAPLPELFDRLVARPMQFGRYTFWLQPTGEPYMGGGMTILPRDFLKLGQLLLDGGTWRGKRVLSKEFAARASSPLVALGTRGRKYGYQWWIDDRPYRDRTVRAVMALGNGGQTVMAVPELDLIIAFMGGNYSDVPLLLSKTNPYVPESILPAVNE